jgi:hypothetical protein
VAAPTLGIPRGAYVLLRTIRGGQKFYGSGYRNSCKLLLDILKHANPDYELNE